MPKHAITIPARRAGRRVRWLIEVSADVREGLVRAKTSKKSTRAKRPRQPSRARSSRRTPVAPAVRVGLAPTTGRVDMSPSAPETTAREKIFMAVVGSLVLGALAVTAYPSLRPVSVARTAQPEAAAQPVYAAAAAPSEVRPAPLAAPAAPVASTHVPRAIDEKPKQPPAKPTRYWPPASMSSSPSAAAASTDAGHGSAEPVASERTTGAPAVASTTQDAASQAVTMSGCLEATVDGDQFRLTDIDGADSPKARSWRSGFLKKRSAPVDLVELADPVGLRKYVGNRVVATGVLAGREMRVRSVQTSGTACN
jgi:hypothetical protein